VTETIIPEQQLRRLKEAADCAYCDVRWAVGDHPELRHVLLTLTIETYRAGYADGLRDGERI
jgi:hypothetical protein